MIEVLQMYECYIICLLFQAKLEDELVRHIDMVHT